jgi:hypothetical protein
MFVTNGLPRPLQICNVAALLCGVTKPTSMNYAAMADAIRKERIAQHIEHLRALAHIQQAAEQSGNYIRAFMAASEWVAVYASIGNIRPMPKGHAVKFKSGGYVSLNQQEPIIPKHRITNITWND